MTIYTIYKATNLINGKSYIGFDSNYPRRKSVHYQRAKENGITYFYNALRKHGKENFTWEILYQSTEKEHTLKVMENQFICEYRTFIGFDDCNGYNMTLGGDGSFGFKHRPETLLKISKTKSKRVYKPQQKIISCKLYDPEGNLHTIDNLKLFCEKNKFNIRSMISLISGRRNSNFGWLNYIDGLSYEETKIKYYQGMTKIKHWKFYDKKGTPLFIYNLYEYCIKNNLLKASMLKVHKEKSYSYKGYIKYIEGLSYSECLNQIDKKKKERSKKGTTHKNKPKNEPYKFIDLENNIIEIYNLSKFCKERNIVPSCMYSLHAGKFYSSHGFRKWIEDK